MNQHYHRTDEEFIQAIADLFNAVAPETPQEIDAYLRECGYDPDEVAAKIALAASHALENQAKKLGLE